MCKRLLTVVLLLAVVLPAAGAARAQGGGDLIFGEPIEAILAEGATDEYVFQSPGRETLSATMTTAVPGFDPVLELYGPDGALIAFSDDMQPGVLDAALVNAPLQTEGTYTLVARSFGNRGSGSYTLTATRLAVFTPVEEVLEIAVGEVVSGEIAVAGEVDRYTFTGTQGQVVSIALNRTDNSASLDPLVELFGPDGTSLAVSDDDGGNLNSLISGFSLPADGVYTIAARSWGNQFTGPYTLSLSEGAAALPPAGPPGVPPQQGLPPVGREGELTLGMPVIGLLAEGTMDVWTFQGESGTAVRISLTVIGALNALDPTVELVGPDGASLAYDDDSGGDLNSLITAARLSADGVYTVRVRAYGDRGGGMYTLLVQAVEIQTNTGNIEPGQTIEATLVPGAADEWTFVARAGQVFTAAVYGEFDTTLRIVNENGSELAYDDDGGPGLNSQIRGWVAPAGGPYTLNVNSFGGDSGGDYTLILATGETYLWPEGWLQGALTFGEPVEGQFTTDLLTHIWTFEARAGDYFQLDASGDFYVELIDAAGSYVNYPGPGVPFRIERGGQYFATLNGYTPGPYTLTLSRAEAPQVNTGNIEPGQTVEATLAPGAVDEWTFSAQAGDRITAAVTARNGAFDTTLRIVDAQGNELAYNDDSGGSLNSEIRDLVLPADGEYTIRVGSFSGSSGGPYTLILESGADEATTRLGGGTIVVGQVVEGDLAVGAQDEWTFTGQRGDVVTISLTARDNAFDTVLHLFNAAGQEIAYNDDGGPGYNSLIQDFILPADGEYTIRVGSFGGYGGGPYTLTLEAGSGGPASATDQTRSIAVGQTVEARLDYGAWHDWAFQADAGAVISVGLWAAPNADLDTVLNVIGPDGATVATDDDGGRGYNSMLVGLRLPASGAYRLRVGSYADQGEGAYLLALYDGATLPILPGALRGALTRDVPTTGALFGDTEHVYTFAVPERQNITIIVTPDDRNIIFLSELYDPAGRPVASGSTRVPIVLQSAAPGEYTLFVYTIDYGSRYHVVWQEAPPPAAAYTEVPAGELVFDSAASGNLEPGQATVYTLAVPPAGAVTLAAYGEKDLDPVLLLYAPDGTLLAQDDNGGRRRDALLRAADLPGGDYRVVVRAAGTDQAGTYRLSVMTGENALTPTGRVGELAIGAPVTGTLDGPLAEDWWLFVAKAGDAVDIRLDADAALADGALIELSGPDGVLLGRSGSVLTGAYLPEDGAYRVAVYTLGTVGGDYTLTVNPAAPNLPPLRQQGALTEGAPVAGTLLPGQNDGYLLQGVAGQIVSLTTAAAVYGSPDTILELYDPRGQRVAYNDDAGGSLNARLDAVRLLTDGTYTVVVRSYDPAEGGAYTLTLINRGGPAVARATVAPGQPAQGQIAIAGQRDTYALIVTAPLTVSIAADTPALAFTPLIGLYAPDGGYLFGNARRLDGITLDTPGTYRVVVSSGIGRGPYTLVVSAE